MESNELIELPMEELREREILLRKELFNLRFQKTLSQMTNPMRIRSVRRDLARVLTFIQKRKKS